MRAIHVVFLVLLLFGGAPAFAAEEPGPVEVGDAIDLVIRLEGGLGPNLCTNSGLSRCERWPPVGRYNQNTAGYGRFGVTFFYPEIVDFIGAGLVLDLGGYSSPSGAASVTFDLAAMVRVFLAVEDDFEFTAGLGLGLGHWSADPSWGWTGLVLPLTVGLGYELFEGWMVGGDLTFQPRLTGSSPNTTQIGVYVAYTFDMTIEGEPASE